MRSVYEKPWDGKEFGEVHVIRSAQKVHGAWSHANSFRHPPSNLASSLSNVKWSKPSLGSLKCNVDAAFFDPQEKVGLLCVLEMMKELLYLHVHYGSRREFWSMKVKHLHSWRPCIGSHP